MSAARHVHIHVTGIVQGVGMRPFVYREAMAHGVCGWVLNAGDGVHIDATAPSDTIDGFVRDLATHAPAAARIEDIRTMDAEDPGAGCSGFRIISSDGSGRRTTLVSPDIATCDDCLRELFDPADRRFHYPFINCTNCGPRFTIIKSLPYDRPATSMGEFPMCPACAQEYADPADRRFHAQPDACFDCGPHLTWRERGSNRIELGGDRAASDVIVERCCELIAAGGIVAIKGLGGFHLACDAADERAVSELRLRKRRGDKPLAVMVGSLEDARALCEIDEAEAGALTGTVRPIVLMRRRAVLPAGALAPSVAGALPELGVMLPYTPLQHLLLAACAARGVRTLVMTSGNLSAEPIETDDEDAWGRLGGIADALLGNDRAILSRYDDSVVRVWRGTVMPVRRARGFAPNPLPLPHAAEAPSVLACGPEQKATLAITRQTDKEPSCFVSQHIGDVGNASTLAAWHDARRRFEQLFDLRPRALACDAHPTYLTSRWARGEHERTGAPLIEVQHHHAHIASVIAEAVCRGDLDAKSPVIGVALDGTGAGDDGTVWGGEVLVATLSECARAGHIACWRLPGATAAVRDARRCALGLLDACGLTGHPGAEPLLARLSDRERAVTATMIERGLNSPVTSSAGRLLDACAALLGICDRATYDGEPAIMLEAAARSAAGAAPDITRFSLLREDGPAGAALVLDSAPVIERLLDGIARREDTRALALMAHESLARAIGDAVLTVSHETGIRTVALSGGVFMNRLLLDRVVELLEREGATVLVPRTVPVNDGCIAYGQAAVACARLSRR